MALTEEQVAALKAEHGDELRQISMGDDVAVVCAPTRVQFKRFMDKSSDAKGDARRLAIEELGRACICHPPKGAELEALIEKRAALLTKAATLALDLAGLGEEAEIEKL